MAYGGKQRMPIGYYPGEKPFRMCVEDPFGVSLEVYSHSYELTYFSELIRNK